MNWLGSIILKTIVIGMPRAKQLGIHTAHMFTTF